MQKYILLLIFVTIHSIVIAQIESSPRNSSWSTTSSSIGIGTEIVSPSILDSRNGLQLYDDVNTSSWRRTLLNSKLIFDGPKVDGEAISVGSSASDYASGSTGILGIRGAVENLTNFNNGSTSSDAIAAGGRFELNVNNPLSSATLSGRTYYLAGIFGKLEGTMTTFPTTGSVGALIAIDEINNSNSYAGIFDGKLHATDLITIGDRITPYSSNVSFQSKGTFIVKSPHSNASIELFSSLGGNASGRTFLLGDKTAGGDGDIYLGHHNSGTTTYRMIIAGNGNVAIGDGLSNLNTTSGYRLAVAGSGSFSEQLKLGNPVNNGGYHNDAIILSKGEIAFQSPHSNAGT